MIPVRPLEIVRAKLIPYVGVGLVDLAMCLLAAHFLFEVPMRGSLGMMVLGGTLYLVVSLLMGLFISGRTRNQFQASQVALLGSLLPCRRPSWGPAPARADRSASPDRR